MSQFKIQFTMHELMKTKSHNTRTKQLHINRDSTIKKQNYYAVINTWLARSRNIFCFLWRPIVSKHLILKAVDRLEFTRKLNEKFKRFKSCYTGTQAGHQKNLFKIFHMHKL